jgi:hypothetical protein
MKSKPKKLYGVDVTHVTNGITSTSRYLIQARSKKKASKVFDKYQNSRHKYTQKGIVSPIWEFLGDPKHPRIKSMNLGVPIPTGRESTITT